MSPERPCAVLTPSGDLIVSAEVLALLTQALRARAPLPGALRVVEQAAARGALARLDRERERRVMGSSCPVTASSALPVWEAGGRGMTVAEAAVALGLAEQSIRRLARSGVLPAERVRRIGVGRARVVWRIDPAAVASAAGKVA